MLPSQFRMPHTDDGQIRDVAHDAEGRLLIEASFDLSDDLLALMDQGDVEIKFSARSRLARLGINVSPTRPVQLAGNKATLEATVRTLVRQYKLDDLLEEIVLPGLKVGRLVLFDAARRLGSEALYQEYSRNAFQLPAAFSIDALGGFTIQPHAIEYVLLRQLTAEDLIAILARDEGKSLLNRLQVARPVEHVLLKPGDGVITSCSMFLHRHYVVLESNPSEFGQHLHSTVLDPIHTRGPRVYLEFFNDSAETIINPRATGHVYAAFSDSEGTPPRSKRAAGRTRRWIDDYDQVRALFEDSGDAEVNGFYFDRPVGVLHSADAMKPTAPAEVEWTRPDVSDPSEIQSRTAQCRVALKDSTVVNSFGTRALDDLPEGGGATVLLQYFPNLQEHLDLARAARTQRIRRIVFRRASFEHGPFLSARDHARLADFADLGVEVLWFNEDRRHLAKHVFRGRRGFFCEADKLDRFASSLIAAMYGSSMPLSDEEQAGLRKLIDALRNFFGNDLAVMTGGGPGAMLHVSEIAESQGLLVGANHLEIEGQQAHEYADFYQVFQENCRHSRQRWFEIAAFHIFCIGGLGTLEEVGMTFTDIKLGQGYETPLVFFGGRAGRDDLYWSALDEQLKVFAKERRGPEWIKSNVLVTKDADEVIAFYKRVLNLG